MSLLIFGICIVQFSKFDLNKAENKNSLSGFAMVICACFLSGFASCYFEKFVKDSNIWLRNFQLSLFGSLFSICYIVFYTEVNSDMFNGIDNNILLVITNQAFGG